MPTGRTPESGAKEIVPVTRISRGRRRRSDRRLFESASHLDNQERICEGRSAAWRRG
jgi:hypothetical protein